MKHLPVHLFLLAVLVAACGQPSPQGPPDTPAPTSPTVAPRSTPAPAASPTLDAQGHLVDTIREADHAYADSEVGWAAVLYERALELDAADDETAQRIRAYARLRLGLAALLLQEDARARELLQDFPDQPADLHQIAFTAWTTYAHTADVEAACQQATELAIELDARIQVQGLSTAPEELCVVPEELKVR